MTPEIITTGAGIIFSLVFSYVPRLNTWYASKDETAKKLIMLALLALVAGGAFGLACLAVLGDLFGVSLTCDKAGGLVLIRSFILAVIANQATYLISPTAPKVKEVKALQG